MFFFLQGGLVKLPLLTKKKKPQKQKTTIFQKMKGKIGKKEENNSSVSPIENQA